MALLKSLTTHIKEEWSITELLTICFQEEERKNQYKPKVAHLVAPTKGKSKKDHKKRQHKHQLKRIVIRKVLILQERWPLQERLS